MEKQRDYLFDNYKGFLIISVVFMHMIHNKIDNHYYYYLYMVVATYVMPGFLIISGYFTHDLDKARDTAVKNFLVLYIIFDTLEAILQYSLSDTHGSFLSYWNLTTPKWGLWYLLVIFFYRLFAKDIRKVKYPVMVFLFTGLTVGMLPCFTRTLALGRTFGLLIFFTIGLFLSKELMERIKSTNKFITLAALIGCILLMIILYKHGLYNYTATYCDRPYNIHHWKKEICERLLFYLIGTGISFSLIPAMSNKETILSSIGRGSLTVYIFHLFVLYPLKQCGFYKIPLTQGVSGVIMICLISFGLSYLLSRNFVKKIYNVLCFSNIAK